MSLDVHLINDRPVTKVGTGVFVRDDGKNRELTLDEVRERWPDAEVKNQVDETTEVYWRNVTHNLGGMASEAGVYEAMWHPERIKAKKAKDIIEPLTAGLKALKADPDKFKKLNPENGWGSYAGLVEAVGEYLEACQQYPEARIEVSV